MSIKLAVITGYARNPEFVTILLHHLRAQTYTSFECYIYATPDCDYFLDEATVAMVPFPCHHLRLEKNDGFAGNNNVTINVALKTGRFDAVVLINDDTIPHPEFLQELVTGAMAHDSIGAVCPKMIFYQPFITIRGVLHGAAAEKGNTKPAMRWYNNSRFQQSFYPKRFYREGFSPAEEDEINGFRWVNRAFTLEMPVAPGSENDLTLQLYLGIPKQHKPETLSIYFGEDLAGEILLNERKLFYELPVAPELVQKHQHDIVQNAGFTITPERTTEIGFGEIDKGQYDTPSDMPLFCGGAVLLKKKALEDAGLFMDGLFSYYEDSDLSIRLRKKGYRITYRPQALIRHYHTGTSKEWSPMFTYYAFRNKIIFSAKTFGFGAFVKAFGERFHETYVYFKLYVKSRLKNHDYRYRLKLNLTILKDALIGIVKFKPKYIAK